MCRHPQETKYAYNAQEYYSAPEVVELRPPQYAVPPTYPAEKVQPDGYPSEGYYEKGKPVQDVTITATAAPAKPRVLGMKKRKFYIVLAAVIVLIILIVGLSAGLAIGLKKKTYDTLCIQPDHSLMRQQRQDCSASILCGAS